MQSAGNSPRSRRLVGFFLAIVAIGGCWPLIACTNEFKTLFLFQDEWMMIKQLDQIGVWRWSLAVFGENFIPVGKLVWFGTLQAFDGSYFAVVVAVWLTHALNAFLVGWLMWRRGCHLSGALLATVLFAYTATAHETLAWTIQWTNVLTVTFLVLALFPLEKILATEPAGWRTHGLMLALLFGCAFSFVRGMFGGLSLAGLMLLPSSASLPWRRRGLVIGLAMLPFAVEIASMKLGAVESVHRVGHFGWATFSQMAAFTVHTYAHNPVANWFGVALLDGWQLAVFATLKTLVMFAGLRLSPPRFRAILIVLVLFEILNDVALGVGRFWTGLSAAGSSRYQDCSLVVFLPFFGVVFARLLETIRKTDALRTAIAVIAVALAGWLVTCPWPQTMRAWCGWRGGELRAALALPPEQAPKKLPRHEWLSYGELHQLMDKYHLH